MREANTQPKKLKLSKETLLRLQADDRAGLVTMVPITWTCYPCPTTTAPDK